MSKEALTKNLISKLLRSEAAIAIAVPSGAYIFVYCYEFGAALYYRYPRSLIQVEIKEIVLVSFLMIVFVGFILLMWEAFKRKVFFTTFLFGAFVTVLFIFIPEPWIYYVIGVLFFLLFLSFSFSALELRGKLRDIDPSLHDELKNSKKGSTEIPHDSLRAAVLLNLKWISSYVKQVWLVHVIIAITGFYMIVIGIGYLISAERSVYYTFLLNKKSFVIVKMYSERAIAAEFEKNNSSIKNSFFVIPVSRFQSTGLVRTKTGPIHFKSN